MGNIKQHQFKSVIPILGSTMESLGSFKNIPRDSDGIWSGMPGMSGIPSTSLPGDYSGPPKLRTSIKCTAELKRK